MKKLQLTFFASGIALLFSFIPNNISAQDSTYVDRPGNQNPLGGTDNITLFRDDELLVTYPFYKDDIQPFQIWSETNYDPEIISDGSYSFSKYSSYDNYSSNSTVASSGRPSNPRQDEVLIFSSLVNGRNTVYSIESSDTNTALYDLSIDQQISDQSIAIAIGDLDRAFDDNNEYLDEVVIAYISEPGTATIEVISYLNPKNPQKIIARSLDKLIYSSNAKMTFDLNVNDYDGDGVLEISFLCWIENKDDSSLTDLQLYVMELNQEGKLIDLTDGLVFSRSIDDCRSIDLDAGDVNRDGTSELMILCKGENKKLLEDGTGYALEEEYPYMWFALLDFKLNEDGVIDDASISLNNDDLIIPSTKPWVSTGGLISEDGKDAYKTGVSVTCNASSQIIPGVFFYNPDSGLGLGKKQICLAWNNDFFDSATKTLTTGLGYKFFIVNSDFELKEVSNNEDNNPEPDNKAYYLIGDKNSNGEIENICRNGFTASAASLIDKDQEELSSPAMQICFGLRKSNSKAAIVVLNPLQIVDEYGYQYLSDSAWSINELSNSYDTPIVVPYDRDGDSFYAGPPIHGVIDNYITTHAIINEPPKHLDYLDNNIVNASRVSDLNIEFAETEEETDSDSNTSASDWSIGGSVTESASLTATAGFAGLESVSVSIEETATLSYNYESNETEYVSEEDETKVAVTGQTNGDDLISYRTQMVDIWRFPIYGLSLAEAENEDDEELHPFYDVSIPLGMNTMPGASGKTLDWYQPAHENGNLLSYPMTQNQFIPSDLGSWSDEYSNDITETFSESNLGFSLGEVSSSYSVSFTDKATSTNSWSTKNTLSESAEVKFSTKAKLTNETGSVEGSASLDLKFNNSNSWSNLGTATTKTSSSKSLKINVPSTFDQATHGYSIYPNFYATQDGTLKVDWSVELDNTTANQAFWDLYYSGVDPALNLPNKFVYDDDTWKIQSNQLAATRMRELVLYDASAEIDSTNNEYPLLSTLSDPGIENDDQALVQIKVQVHNYSTKSQVDNVKVSFYLMQLDFNNQEIGNPIPLINTDTANIINDCDDVSGEYVCVPQIGAREAKTATFLWDIRGLGGDVIGGSVDYNLYTTLDPFDEIEETHEGVSGVDVNWNGNAQDVTIGNTTTQVDWNPGQNNQGWTTITVQRIDPSDYSGTIVSEISNNRQQSIIGKDGKDCFLTAKSLSIEGAFGKSVTRMARVPVGQSTKIKARLFAKGHHNESVHLMLYNGKPERGQLIAHKVIHGIDKINGASVWVNWTPPAVGRYEIYAEILEKSDDPKLGNNRDVILLNAF